MAQHSEILIIGGGVIGLSIAHSLRKAGVRDIAILDRGTLGCEASAAAAGMLAPQAEADSADTFFEFCRDSLALYEQFAHELLDETGIDIELDRTGTLYLGFNTADAEELSNRFRWQREAGLDVEQLSIEDVIRLEPNVSGHVNSGLLFPNDWQVENRRLLSALSRFAKIHDVGVYENTRVDELIVENGRAAGVISGSRRFLAKTTIVTTGAWTSLVKFGDDGWPFDVRPMRGQMICFRPERPMFSHVVYSPRGYVVPRADGRVLVGATVEDVGFEKDVTEAGVESLRTAAFEIAPTLESKQLVEKWSGLRPFVADGLPVIGALERYEDLLVATGHYRNGILLAPITAELIKSKLITGAESAYFDAFGAKRFNRSTNAVR
ncbi:MAG TPA: glycine oxidase ThiO [Pyrinomonadaceae bacterium]|nr:glycine oxidase ThiO [Pyrinomonadaceae bacterium]